MNIREYINENDLNLFFQRIREDNGLNEYELVDFINDIAFGQKRLLFEENEEIWKMEKLNKSLKEEVEELMNTLQEMRNDPRRRTTEDYHEVDLTGIIQQMRNRE